MRKIEVKEPVLGVVVVGRGWIVLSIILFVLTCLMGAVALRNAVLLDCEHVYPDNGKYYCISEIK